MEKVIAACGNDCASCPRYTAHPYEKSDEALHHTAELWMKIGYRDHVISNEEIACYGSADIRCAVWDDGWRVYTGPTQDAGSAGAVRR